MIIKSTSYKHPKSFTTVLRYILREQEQENGFVLTKFIHGKDTSVEHLAQCLMVNEEFRIHPRKNNVRLYMDILSFHAQDHEHLPNTTLQAIALKYLSLRAPNSIAIATVHRNEKEHTHLHICFSGVAYKTGKAVRISKADFHAKVKLPMEAYQRAQFPELSLSEINHHVPVTCRTKEYRKDVELTMAQRGRPSEKQRLIQDLDRAFTLAHSEQDFYARMQQNGWELYLRDGAVAGVSAGRKFRLRTLGYTPEVIAELNRDMSLQKRLDLLRKLRQSAVEKDRYHER